jgi:hypothetical protein
MHKIGSTSKLQIEYQKAIMVIRRPFWTIALAMLGSIVFYYFFWSSGIFEKIENKTSIYLFTGAIMVFAFVQGLYRIGASEHIEIDLASRTVTRKQKFLWISYKNTTNSWPVGHGFKYSVDYDSYKRITAIWLVAYSSQSNESRKLFRFFDKKTFVAFQDIFNESFPANKILEWHD